MDYYIVWLLKYFVLSFCLYYLGLIWLLQLVTFKGNCFCFFGWHEALGVMEFVVMVRGTSKICNNNNNNNHGALDFGMAVKWFISFKTTWHIFNSNNICDMRIICRNASMKNHQVEVCLPMTWCHQRQRGVHNGDKFHLQLPLKHAWRFISSSAKFYQSLFSAI